MLVVGVRKVTPQQSGVHRPLGAPLLAFCLLLLSRPFGGVLARALGGLIALGGVRFLLA